MGSLRGKRYGMPERLGFGPSQALRLFLGLALAANMANTGLNSEAMAKERTHAASRETKFENIRKQIDHRIPDSVVKALYETRAVKKKTIDEINSTRSQQHFEQLCKLLESEVIAKAFVKNPVRIARILGNMINEAGGNNEPETVKLMIASLKKIDSLFVSNTWEFSAISRAARGNSWLAFRELANENTAALFTRYPKIFATMATASGAETYEILQKLRESQKLSEALTQYPIEFAGLFSYPPEKRNAMIVGIMNGTLDIGKVAMSTVSSYDSAAIELGRQIDDAANETEKAHKLGNITDHQTVGLACSNPELFTKSTNQLLLERVKRGSTEDGLEQLRKTYGLDDAQMRNLILRAISNGLMAVIAPGENSTDRAYAKTVIVGRQKEKTGIYSDRFDQQYFYHLANGIERTMAYAPGVIDEMEGRLAELNKRNDGNGNLTGDEETIRLALTYVLQVSGKTSSQELNRAVFDVNDYRGTDGKVTIVQIFDREDTHGYHWHASRSIFRKKYGMERIESDTTVSYEDNNSRVILFMGKDRASNTAFVEKWVSAHKVGIITFRGESFHLTANMPSRVFGNRNIRYVFVPGSCGSAASIPEYLSANPSSDLRTMSYISTGRGQVTNALVEALLDQRVPIRFSAIVERNSDKITARGGEPELIRTWRPGDSLMEYISNHR